MARIAPKVMILIYLGLLVLAGGTVHLLDRQFVSADREDTERLLDQVGRIASEQVELAIAAGYPDNGKQFVEALAEAQPRIAARIEMPGQRHPTVFGEWPIAFESIETDHTIGAANNSPPIARLSFRMDPAPPNALARTLLLTAAIVGPVGAFSLCSVSGRARRSSLIREMKNVIQSRVDTLRESRGRERGAGQLDPRLEDRFDELASVVASMSAYKEFFTNALQSMVDSLLIVNAEGVMLAVNQAVVNSLGYTEDELLGQNVSMIWADDKGLLLNADRLSKILSEGARNDLALSFRTRSGRNIPVNLSGSAIRSRSGEVTGYVCIAADVTERKKADREKERLNRELVDTSRRAGMAEVATGVLHNVGNVLNSVTVTASSITDLVNRSRVTKLGQLNGLIDANRDNLSEFLTQNPKGRVIPDYLAKLTETLDHEHESLRREVEELNKNVEHIKKVITVQQRVARVSGVNEPVDAKELLEDAIRIRESSFSKHGIRLIKNFTLSRSINTDKHKVLQILVNLVGNAIDAMSDHEYDSDNPKRILSVSASRCRDDNEFVVIEVADTGPGIAPQNLTRIFTHGFTTKKNGHGFGLHSAAIAARELGGSLTCRNRDHGTGASFTLRLPLEVQEESREAAEAAA